ncbi:hypothetical protein RD792_001757 [Penstemon davidsonii]|uniref:GED domain-containing protein n=1 Tax=Penstemon davidsonii TaxID=160366 RepID=A0ABR0DQA1_9LAMI|nr:hypothetical protein RD792_001757 [Penstemon davidsonii]
MQISYACEPIEMQRFPMLRRRLDDILKKFLHEGVKEAERMIENLIDMEMSYINSSHPKFIGGKNAVELALQHGRASKVLATNITYQKGNDLEQQTKFESGQKSQESFIKPEDNGVSPNQLKEGQPQSYSYKAKAVTAATGYEATTWPSRILLKWLIKGWKTDSLLGFGPGFLTTRIRGISSVFGSRGQPSMENSYNGLSAQTMQESEASVSIIQLNKLPSNLRLLETQTEDETVEVVVTKLLLTSYYDIVRKNVQDLVPKAIMHFLVRFLPLFSSINGPGRFLSFYEPCLPITFSLLFNLSLIFSTAGLQNIEFTYGFSGTCCFPQRPYNLEIRLSGSMEEDEIAIKRKTTSKMFHILQQAVKTLDEIVADVHFRAPNMTVPADFKSYHAQN